MNVNPKVFVSKLLAEPWAMEPRRLRDFVGELVAGSAMVDAEIIKAAKADDGDPNEGSYSVVDGVAHIPIQGVILKSVPCVFSFFGVDATSTQGVAASVDKALADKDVSSIVFDIDSPGGTVAGVQELADKIWGVAQRGSKPVEARISDLAASAAYWIGSQANRVTVNESGAVGSIGVYTVVDDISGAYEKMGIKTHVVSSHELKGAGVPGAPVTEAQLADIKRNVLDYASLFESAVSRARGMSPSKIEKVATGQVWLGAEAMSLGLVDGIRGIDQQTESRPSHGATAQMETPMTGEQEKAMSEKVAAPVAMSATDEIEKLKAEAEQAKAEAKAAREESSAMRDRQLTDLLVRYENRINPKAKDAIEKTCQSFGNISDAEAYLKDLPEVTKPERESAVPERADRGMLDRYQATETEKKLAARMGVNIPQYRKLSVYSDNVASVKRDGTAVLYDGTEIPPGELDKALGLN